MNVLKYFIVLTIFGKSLLQAQIHDRSWQQIIHRKEGAWFATKEAMDIAENVLLYQRNIGGWPKNIQMQKPLSANEKTALLNLRTSTEGCTTDNGATCGEMLFLSKIYRQHPDQRYKEAFLRGLNYLLEAQYDNGGWPQFYPLKKGYYTHITYNDDSMFNILSILKELKDGTNRFSITPSQGTIKKIKIAFDKGIDCILKTQYKQHGVLTSWCAQYDENTFEPAKARSYELPSLSGKESANLVLLLMSLNHPSPEVIKAVNSAVAWFKKVKITGLRRVRVFNDKGKVINKKVIQDADAPPLWARFMELDDNTPFFCDRDGIKKYALSEIGSERRNGYAWYTTEPSEMLKKYEAWSKKYNVKKNDNSEEIIPKNPHDVTVAKDGSGDFTTIQDAIYASKAFPYQRVIIHIKNGTYNEKVHVYAWNTHVSLIGESREHTVITYSDYFDKINLGRNSTFLTSTLLVEGNDFIAENLTIENTSGKVGQAVALSVNANRCYFENCSFLGFQDTVYTAGEGFKQYFKNCYIEGSTDFIFGEATVLFESCTIHSKANSYITAASTPQGQAFGYVFKNCKLTADDGVTDVYLGRPWRIYARTVFINCEMEKHILPEGWHNWSKPEAEKNAFYAEFQNTGKGFQPKKRVGWSHQLKASEAEIYTIKNILGEHKDNLKSEWYEAL